MASGETTKTGWFSRVDPRRRTSISTRLAVATLAVAIATVVVSVVVSSASVSRSAGGLIDQSVAVRASTAAEEVRVYLANMTRNLQLLANSTAVAEVSGAFIDAFDELDAADPDDLTSETTEVTRFYLDTYLPEISEVRGQAADPSEFFPRSNAAALYLQDAYIARNPFVGDERRLLTNGEDDSTWTGIHVDAHPAIRNIAERLGFLDLMVVDADTQSIVYSIAKDVAFATNLDTGPHSGSTLAAVVRRVLAEPAVGEVIGADVAIYPPSIDRPRAFLASPLSIDGRIEAVLVGALSFDEITSIMTSDWREGRFGDTGEMYLIGEDRRMRSDARMLLENPGQFFDRIDSLDSVAGIDRNRMEALGTSVVFQSVDSEAAQRGIDGETGSVRTVNYLGDEVLSAFVPIEGDALTWVLIVEQGLEEAESRLAGYVRSMVVITVVTVVLLTFLTVAWAGTFMAPVRAMSSALQHIRRGEENVDIPIGGAREFRELGHRLDTMVVALRGRRVAVLEALRSKSAVIRTLMPDAAAERIGKGERQIVEAVPQASVVAIVIDGLDESIASRDAASSRDFLHELVDGIDAAADSHGLERVKIHGDLYIAVCGLSSPHIDHAPRSATFAEEAVAWTSTVAGEWSIDVAARAGVSSGPVAAGLVGNTRLVFDLWGEAVDEASALALAGSPFQVVISRSAHDRMPSGAGLTPVDVDGRSAWLYGGRSSSGPTP
jgi:class 3 adenylate cyclase